MDPPKLELLVYLPGGRTEVVDLPPALAAELCSGRDWPAFPLLPPRVALSATLAGGCGLTVVYDRQPEEKVDVDRVRGVSGKKPRRPSARYRAA